MPATVNESQSEADAAAGNIREIVAMVKSGKINKSDAFNELRHLLKHSNSTRSQRSDDNDSQAEEEDNMQHMQVPPPNPSDSIDFSAGHQKANSAASNQPSQSRFSKEDRRILINTLIEKKRRDRLQQANSFDGDEHSLDRHGYEDDYYNEDNQYPEQPRMEYDDDMDSDQRRGFPPPAYEESNQEGFGLNFREYNDASSISSSGVRSRQSTSRERPRSAGRLGGSAAKQHFRSAGFNSRANDDSRLSDYRAQKVRLAESATRAEMFKECTFEPKIKELPPSYGASKERDDHFYDRVMRWQREKEMESTRRKTLSSHNEVVDCTFQPRISKNSQRSVRMTRGADSANKDTPSCLYESNSSIIYQKAKVIEDHKARELEEATKECTFQPRINKKQAWDYVEPKYNREKSQPSPEEQSRDAKQYSFTPKVNEVRKSMSSAKLYLSMNVVDRLTKPIPAEPEDSEGDVDDQHFDSGMMDRPVMDVASFMGSLQSGQGGPYNTPANKRPGSAGSSRRKSGGSTATASSRQTLSAEEKELRNQSFQTFLGRQNQTLMRKERRVEELGNSLQPEIRTHVNNKSRRIVEDSHKGEFIDRVQRDVLRREQSVSAKLTARGTDKECSFRPEVSKKAEQMRSRSVYELSRGDAHKQETSRRLLRLKNEQEELKNLTFQPRMATSPSRQTRSALQLRENPGGFMERHMNTLKQNEAERKKILESRRQEELQSCTFNPKTKDCPAYVKRIARSLSVVKRSHSGDDQPSKPQWK